MAQTKIDVSTHKGLLENLVSSATLGGIRELVDLGVKQKAPGGHNQFQQTVQGQWPEGGIWIMETAGSLGKEALGRAHGVQCV